MTVYKANTGVMRDTSGTIKSAGERLREIVEGIKIIDVNPNAYDGQLAEQVTPILEEFPGEFEDMPEKLSINGKLLGEYADSTDAFFAQSKSGMMGLASGISVTGLSVLSSLSLQSQLRQNLYYEPHSVGLAMPSKQLTGQSFWNGDTYDGNIKLTDRSKGIAISENKVLGFNAANVRGDPNGNIKTPYYRLSADKKKASNCVWYAAEAVKYTSGGKIDLHEEGWHNAWQWAGNAEGSDIVDEVNSTPRPGSVYAIKYKDENGNIKGGHVAFVEEVIWEEKNGKPTWKIVVSEEDYYDSESLKSVRTKVNNIVGDVDKEVRVVRYTRTISEETDAEFIHFKYQADNN